MNISGGLLPFQLIEDNSKIMMTSFAGVPLVIQTFKTLGLRGSIRKHLSLLQRPGKYEEADYMKSFVSVFCAWGDCVDDFELLRKDEGLGELAERINKNLITGGGKRIQKETVIAVDLSDLDKPYGQKMESLGLVRDGSSGETKSSGYWLIDVVGADLIALYRELYSQDARDFRSENCQVLNAIDRVMEGIGRKGIWAMDQGGDRSRLFKGFFERKLRFVVR